MERLGPNDSPEPIKDIMERVGVSRLEVENIPGGQIEPACSICGGTGWLYRTTEDGKTLYGRTVACPCRAAETKAWRVQLSRLPVDDTTRLSNFEARSGTQAALKAAMAMADGTAPHHFLTLAGAPGTGKTHLARGIGWAWIEKARGSVLYYKVSNLLDDFKKGYDEKPEHKGQQSGFDRLMGRVSHVQLLILDDLGVEKVTEWSMDRLDSIVDDRYENRLATVITTNLTMEQLGERVRSRLREGVTSYIKASDYREIKAKQRGKPK